MNRIFGENPDNILPITSTLTSSQIQQGDVLCASRGFSTVKFRCGEVTRTCANDLQTSGGWTILCVGVLDFDSTGGDSGSPIIEQYYDPVVGKVVNWAAGIHTHSSDDTWCDNHPGQCRSWFTKADRVESESPADICTSAAC